MSRLLAAGVALGVSIVAGGVAGGVAGPAMGRGAGPDRPTVVLDQTTVQPGQRILVTLSGWTARNVTLSVCGNLGRRGSADCNLAASQAETLVNAPGPTLVKLTVFAPPGTCPCVIRAASGASDEVVVVPVELVGVPLGPVVGPAFGAPVVQSLQVRPAPAGPLAAARAALGGPTTYLVTVSLRNQTAETLTGIALVGSVGRAPDDSVVSFDLPPPGDLGPGQTWEHVDRVTVPAPVINRFYWRVTVSGAGVPVDDQLVTRRLPVGLLAVAAILVIDLAAMAWYFGGRWSRRRPRPTGPAVGDLPPVLTPTAVG